MQLPKIYTLVNSKKVCRSNGSLWFKYHHITLIIFRAYPYLRRATFCEGLRGLHKNVQLDRDINRDHFLRDGNYIFQIH